MCEYCEQGRILKQKISQIIEIEGVDFTGSYEQLHEHFFKLAIEAAEVLKKRSSDLLMNEIMEAYYLKNKSITEQLKSLEAISFHKSISRLQRDAYNANLKNVELLNDHIMIEIDFKQKFAIGLSPRQVSKEYYEQVLRSCLGKKLIY